MKSLYSVSATRIRLENKKPNIPTTLVYGDKDANRPLDDWFKKLSLDKELISEFGHELYADEKVIKKICLDLLESVTTKLDRISTYRSFIGWFN